MKRDMDLIRELLLKLEGLDNKPGSIYSLTAYEDLPIEGRTPDQIDYHMGLLYEAGLLDSGDSINRMMSGGWLFSRLSWSGHEFLDSIRDPEVWRRTKEGASKVGGWTVGLLKDISAAYLKYLAKEKLGLDI